MTETLDTYRTCAHAPCDNVFGVTSKHPTKIYCSPKCRTQAGKDRERVETTDTEIAVDVNKIDELQDVLAERGMKLEDWVVVRVTVNKWEGFLKTDAGEPLTVPLRQLKIYLRPKTLLAELIQPAAVSLNIPKGKVPNRNHLVKKYFIYGDDQWPHADETFKRLQLAWVKYNQPDEIIDLGDGCDMPTISTHKVDPSQNWTVQECADTYATWLYKLRNAAPDAPISILADNHMTGRLRDYQTAKAAALYGVTPAQVPGLSPDLEMLWSVPRLLRLDELRIKYVTPPGDTHYAESYLELIPEELVAIHGYRTGANLGKKFIEDHGCSVIYGHQHGQDLYVTDTRRRGVGKRKRLYALGVGCGSQVNAVNYAPGSDHQNCALTVSEFSDGHWSFSYMNYEHGVLTWQDQKYTT